MTNIKKHVWYYCITVALFAIGLSLIFASNANHTLQSIFIMMIAVMYFVWSLVHHYVHHKLHARVVVEYALMTILGVVLALFLFGV